jgi:hypothetical protein
MAPHTIRDRITFNSNIEKLRRPAFAIISALQDFADPAEQIEALYLTAAILAQTNGLDAHDMIARARRQIADAEAGRTPFIDAIRDYAAGELR